MPDAKNALADLVRGDGEPPARIEPMTVTAVGEGTVNVSWGSTLIEDVACAGSYGPRRAGDVVLVAQTGAGWWVLCAVGPNKVAALPGDVVYQSDVDDVVRVGDTQATTTTWGTGSPGSGWHQAQSVWVKDGGVYAQLSGSADPPPPPTNRPKHHRPVTLPATGALYMDGRKTSSFNRGRPVQGAWPTYPHASTGLWVYGTSIAAACAGKTVQSMSIRLSRTKSGGNPRIRPRLYLHDQTSAPARKPSLGSSWVPKKILQRGEVDEYDLPASWVSQLASGAARGIACSASTGKSYYLRYGVCGQLTITFA